MTCPKCEIGDITQIILKENQFLGFLCEYCGTVWFGDEDINTHTGHLVQILGKEMDQAYTFVDVPQVNQDTKPIPYPMYR